MEAVQHGRRGRRRRAREDSEASASEPRTTLMNCFSPVPFYSDTDIDAIHANALRILQETGIRILHDKARAMLVEHGASVDADDHLVRFPRELVEQAMASAPSEFDAYTTEEHEPVRFGGRSAVFAPVGGAPYASDLEGGKRPGTLEDYTNFVKLVQHFDVLHVQSAMTEPQDVPIRFRHLETMHAQLTLSDKLPWVFCRGHGQVMDGFEMVRIARGLSEEEFREKVYIWGVINTNSPRVLDSLMVQGLIDFAEWGQMMVITPFTLSGAMAPVTIPGALSQQHAEFLAALTIHQLVRPGAPVVYGAFTSNVDMRSGAPAFGTPEYVRAAMGSGQLARKVGVPWRSSGSCTSNCVDAQAAYETQMALWGAMLGGANLLLHAAGWLEGGLTASFEKLIVDVEMLQQMAELFQPQKVTDEDLAFDAIASVEPGGHYFGEDHTLARYDTAFYTPVLSDWSNFGQWSENGEKTATERANEIYRSILDTFEPVALAADRRTALDAFVARRKEEGGAEPDG
ncbi:trimethylamine methyltransferase family protein [Coralliovum pocilloporae]|uniref:trimethylamine methyltransferase family protein n=1 Tax=Coralliovum pocilloporae TaxID=3066369 RepID=UPI00330788C9